MYGCPEKKAHEQLRMRAKEHLKQAVNELKNGSFDSELKSSPEHHASDRQTRNTSPRILSTVCYQSSVSYYHIHITELLVC